MEGNLLLFFVQVKETRKALKDSESGLEKMAIGHHINDRAHVIKKSKNSKTGDEEMNQEFINLDESMSLLCSSLMGFTLLFHIPILKFQLETSTETVFSNI